MNIIDCLEERGLIESTTGGEFAKPCRLYVGFDPTAESLHIGNLVGIVVAGWFQRCGHTPIALVGGATGLIGDPSGRSHERPLLTPEQVRHNVEGIRRNIEAVLGEVWIVNNLDWWSQMSAIDYLREVGKYARMGPMLSKEMVRTRLESDEGLSYTEFSYQLIQGYDFVHLFDECGVTVQVGGSDQWGNIVSGVEMVRKLRGESVHALTWPLLTRSDGKKFGKSVDGAIWLSADKLSPYEFYQYLFRLPDADLLRMMRMLTFMPMEEIHEWKRRMESSDYVANSAQKRLAQEVTQMVHGEEGVQAALKVTEGMNPGSMTGPLTAEALSGMPHVLMPEAVGMSYLDLLVATNLVNSKGDARRLVRNGGAYLNNEKVEDEGLVIGPSHPVDGLYLLLGAGKKKKIVVKIASS